MRTTALVVLTLFAALPVAAQGHSGSCTCGGFAALPIPWEIDHRDPAYIDAARGALDRWNAYVNAFDGRAGDGVMAPNGKNEVGFLDIATASARYGINMDRNTFAITYMTPLSAAGDFDACPKPPQAVCGTFAEADVIVNADFDRGFVPAGPVDFTDRGPASYAATVLHELGHALGFHHNVGNLSVMNLYEDFAAQYIAAADTEEARRAYPSAARPVLDAALYPFYFDPALTDYAATMPVEVWPVAPQPGSSFTIRNFGFENVGSEQLPDVQIRFYLASNPDRLDTAVLIGSLVFDAPVQAGAFWDDRGEGVGFALPSDLGAGTYALIAIISNGSGSSDAVTYNNRWIAPQTVTVLPPTRRRAARH